MSKALGLVVLMSQTLVLTDVVAVTKYLAFKKVLSFSCILKHEDFEMKTNWLQKWIPRAILGLEIMYVYFFDARRILTSPA